MTPSRYRRYLNLAAEQRVVTTGDASTPAIGADDIEVTDEMITAYYDDNAMLYQLPETADIEYIEISRNEVAENVES